MFSIDAIALYKTSLAALQMQEVPFISKISIPAYEFRTALVMLEHSYDTAAVYLKRLALASSAQYVICSTVSFSIWRSHAYGVCSFSKFKANQCFFYARASVKHMLLVWQIRHEPVFTGILYKCLKYQLISVMHMTMWNAYILVRV